MRVLSFLAVLLTAAGAASATVTPLPGSTPQSARANIPFLNQLGVVVTDANGAPVAGAYVGFTLYAFLGPNLSTEYRTFDCLPDLGWNCHTTTDSQGVALLPGMYGASPFHYRIPVSAGTSLVNLGSTTIELDVTGNPDPAPFKSLQDMWWSGVAENGWGMSVVEHGAQLFSVVYAYDAQGNPTWWVMPAGTWNAGFFLTSYLGNLYAPRAAPYFAYDSARFAAGAPAGTAELTFSGPDAASLGVTIGGVVMRKQIQRMTDIGGDSTADNHGVGDMWWGGPSQNGWGVSIVERNGVLFAVWLTYDADGKPTWLVMPGGSWSGDAYSGPLIRTHGAAWVGTGYDVSKFGAAATGTYTLRFTDAHNATLDYSIDGHSGSAALVRQAF